MHADVDVALVFIRHKTGGQPAAKEKRAQTEACQQHQHERALVNYRVRPADKTIRTAFPIAIEDVKEFPERPPALVSSFLWFWPQQQTRERRAERERIERGEHHGNGDGQSELLIKSPGDARNERRRDEHRSQHQRNPHNWSGELFHRLHCRVLRSQSLLDMALHTFDNHNRVVDHQTDSQDQAQH